METINISMQASHNSGRAKSLCLKFIKEKFIPVCFSFRKNPKYQILHLMEPKISLSRSLYDFRCMFREVKFSICL